MFPLENREDLQKLNESASSQNQIKATRIQDGLGEQNFHEDVKEVFEPLSNPLKDNSENITKTITEISIKNIKAISDLNEKVLDLMDEKVLI